jgi:hypothetical protein
MVGWFGERGVLDGDDCQLPWSVARSRSVRAGSAGTRCPCGRRSRRPRSMMKPPGADDPGVGAITSLSVSVAAARRRAVTATPDASRWATERNGQQLCGGPACAFVGPCHPSHLPAWPRAQYRPTHGCTALLAHAKPIPNPAAGGSGHPAPVPAWAARQSVPGRCKRRLGTALIALRSAAGVEKAPQACDGKLGFSSGTKWEDCRTRSPT